MKLNTEYFRTRRLINFIFNDDLDCKCYLRIFSVQEGVSKMYLIKYNAENGELDYEIDDSIDLSGKDEFLIEPKNGCTRFEVSIYPHQGSMDCEYSAEYIREEDNNDNTWTENITHLSTNIHSINLDIYQSEVNFVYTLFHNSPTIPVIAFAKERIAPENIDQIFTKSDNVIFCSLDDMKVDIDKQDIVHSHVASQIHVSNPAKYDFNELYSGYDIQDATIIEDKNSGLISVVNPDGTINDYYEDVLVSCNYEDIDDFSTDMTYDMLPENVKELLKSDQLDYNKETPDMYHTVGYGTIGNQYYATVTFNLVDESDESDVICNKTVTGIGDINLVITNISWNEGTNNHMITKILEPAREKLLLQAETETLFSLFNNTNIVTLEDYKTRVANTTETNMDGSIKGRKLIYESPELYMYIDIDKGKIEKFESPIYNLGIDKFVYLRDFYGCLYKFDISKYSH